MCGLFVQWSARVSQAEPILMALRRRGPDDEGQWQQPVAGGVLQMLHTRLAIQDLTSAGHQPMRSSDQRFVLVFNGEIYNAPALRSELEHGGVRFRSHSDTEVVLEGFARWGVELFPRLNGIFALAIWDEEQHSLTLARDRFGVKPLLWWRDSSAWAVASELSVLRAAGLPPKPQLDRQALEQFWQWGSVQSPRTLVMGVQCIPPGYWARWEAQASTEQWHLKSFAELPTDVLTSNELSYREAVTAVASAFEQAVERQMLADVPVGAFLSGGLDSASVVALMAACAHRPVCTFSLGFASDDLSSGVVDERSLAACTARHFGTDHHEVVLTASEVLGSLSEFCDAIDQPSVDGLNTFLVARAASARGLRVAMSGLGGDELFAGYPVFQRAWLFESRPSSTASFRSRLPWKVLQRLGWEYCRFSWGSLDALGAHRRLHPGTETMGALLSIEEAELDLVAQISRLELRGYMANTLLRDSDAVTMHHGLELRVPFLDSDLADLILRLPSAYKMGLGIVKPLLGDAIGVRLPEAILKAPKRGFELPFASWLQDLEDVQLPPEILGHPWPKRISRARRAFYARPKQYHAWWQWQILARWLMQWPELLDSSLCKV